MRQEARLRKRMTGMVETIEAKKGEAEKTFSSENLAAMRDNLIQALTSIKRDT